MKTYHLAATSSIWWVLIGIRRWRPHWFPCRSGWLNGYREFQILSSNLSNLICFLYTLAPRVVKAFVKCGDGDDGDAWLYWCWHTCIGWTSLNTEQPDFNHPVSFHGAPWPGCWIPLRWTWSGGGQEVEWVIRLWRSWEFFLDPIGVGLQQKFCGMHLWLGVFSV
jgi:hypothetical protein